MSWSPSFPPKKEYNCWISEYCYHISSEALAVVIWVPVSLYSELEKHVVAGKEIVHIKGEKQMRLELYHSGILILLQKRWGKAVYGPVTCDVFFCTDCVARAWEELIFHWCHLLSCVNLWSHVFHPFPLLPQYPTQVWSNFHVKPVLFPYNITISSKKDSEGHTFRETQFNS